jgi:hypothetical protein
VDSAMVYALQMTCDLEISELANMSRRVAMDATGST